MEKNQKQGEFLGYLHWLIGIGIMGLGYIVPASEPLTPMGVKILAIFVGMIYLWCTVNPIGGSFVALFAVSVVGYAPFSEVLSAGISESNWLVVFFGCVLFMSAIESGMPKYISHGIFKISKNMITGRPMVLIFIMMCATFIMSALTDIISTILMFWSVSYTIIEELKLEKKDRYSTFLIISCFMGSMLGNAFFPFKGAILIIISAFESASGIAIPYGPYMLINAICSLIIMVAYCLLGKYICRLDLEKVGHIDGTMLAREKLEPMSISVKAHMGAIALFILLVLFTSFLPAGSALQIFLSNLGTQGIAVLAIILLFVVRESGKSVIKMNKVMARMPWGAVFMVMAAVYMASALKNKDVTGIIPWFKMILNPVLGGHSEFIFASVMFLVGLIMTCFFHNGALGNMLMPVLFAVAEANGYAGAAIAAMLTMSINIAFLAPSASNYAPMLHGNREYVSLKDIWTMGLMFEILAFAVFLVVGLPMAKLLM